MALRVLSQFQNIKCIPRNFFRQSTWLSNSSALERSKSDISLIHDKDKDTQCQNSSNPSADIVEPLKLDENYEDLDDLLKPTPRQRPLKILTHSEEAKRILQPQRMKMKSELMQENIGWTREYEIREVADYAKMLYNEAVDRKTKKAASKATAYTPSISGIIREHKHSAKEEVVMNLKDEHLKKYDLSKSPLQPGNMTPFEPTTVPPEGDVSKLKRRNVFRNPDSFNAIREFSTFSSNCLINEECLHLKKCRTFLAANKQAKNFMSGLATKRFYRTDRFSNSVLLQDNSANFKAQSANRTCWATPEIFKDPCPTIESTNNEFEVCDKIPKKYEPTMPCECVEPPAAYILPKMKRLQKRYTTQNNPPQFIKECAEWVCPPRADASAPPKVKKLGPPPCGGCKCIDALQLKSGSLLKRPPKNLFIPDEIRCEEFLCPPRADEHLSEKVKKLPTLPCSNCPCKEECGPFLLPKLRRISKKYNTNVNPFPEPKHCRPHSCAPRADDGMETPIKPLRTIKAGCICIEPRRLEECHGLKRLPKKVLLNDPCLTDCPLIRCPLRADDVCGYESSKRKLKPLLSCRPMQANACFSTFTRSFHSKHRTDVAKDFPDNSCPTFKVLCCPPRERESYDKDTMLCDNAKYPTPYKSYADLNKAPLPIPSVCPDNSYKYLQPKYPIFGNTPLITSASPQHSKIIDLSIEDESISKKSSADGESRTLSISISHSDKMSPFLRQRDFEELKANARKPCEEFDKIVSHSENSEKNISDGVAATESKDTAENTQSPCLTPICQPQLPPKEDIIVKVSPPMPCPPPPCPPLCLISKSEPPNGVCALPKEVPTAKPCTCQLPPAPVCPPVPCPCPSPPTCPPPSGVGSTDFCVPTPYPCIPSEPFPQPKTLMEKIIAYFRARPGCPSPDEWKRRLLVEKAEKAAKAAGMELCFPKCPPPLTCIPRPRCDPMPPKPNPCLKPRSSSGQIQTLSFSSHAPTTPIEPEFIVPRAPQSVPAVRSEPTKVYMKDQAKDSSNFITSANFNQPPEEAYYTQEAPHKSSMQNKNASQMHFLTPTTVNHMKVRQYSDDKKCDVPADCDQTAEDPCKQTPTTKEESHLKIGRDDPLCGPDPCNVKPHCGCKPRERPNCRDVAFKYRDCCYVEAPFAAFTDCHPPFPRLPYNECTEQERIHHEKMIIPPSKAIALKKKHEEDKKKAMGRRKFSTFTRTFVTSGQPTEESNEPNKEDISLSINESIQETAKAIRENNTSINCKKMFTVIAETLEKDLQGTNTFEKHVIDSVKMFYQKLGTIYDGDKKQEFEEKLETANKQLDTLLEKYKLGI